MFYFFGLLLVIQVMCDDSGFSLRDWSNVDLHCRDNSNKPVEWWYIYKPPMGAAPNLEMGRNFSFITPQTRGKWEVSYKYINSDSMLQRTLSPLFRPVFKENLAVVAYNDNEGFLKSSAHGLMIADEIGGIWMGYTLPSLLDFSGDQPSFPSDSLENGHLITCLSLNLSTLNSIAALLREIKLSVLRLKVPPNMRTLLPHWQYFNRPLKSESGLKNRFINFSTTGSSLRGVLLIRRSGEKECLYKTFAKIYGVVLDVYGHDGRSRPYCEREFGVRIINSISLKYESSVYYISNHTDKANFAVSTAADWQRRGSGPRQFWTCTSSVRREDSSTNGGILVCVHDYNVWWSFDNMKIKEPHC